MLSAVDAKMADGTSTNKWLGHKVHKSTLLVLTGSLVLAVDAWRHCCLVSYWLFA
ncbi:MAG: hypothetical protein Terrestrivirus10_34 [Terrestrivirus sp.]|uniref:Uncharacterized protein n=1 Tax=Terrestrivirus sp. TaxID=2487775 RepID=A0A3G4ZP31_9VIRU|nr:MAG: hypothetical protein Terrestrivirus10_34 [Terrestrivirus sp.]